MSKDNIPDELRHRYRMTKRHLALLGRDRFLFRMFTEGHKGGPQTLIGTLDEHYRELVLANRRGRGIFVQANDSDGDGDKGENIISAPCFFVDLDKVPIENIDRFPLEPHLIIETSPGRYHAYWRVEGIPVDRFTEVQRRLIGLIGSDPVIHDLPRLMRLAGFNHLKKPESPFLTRIIDRHDATSDKL